MGSALFSCCARTTVYVDCTDKTVIKAIGVFYQQHIVPACYSAEIVMSDKGTYLFCSQQNRNFYREEVIKMAMMRKEMVMLTCRFMDMLAENKVTLNEAKMIFEYVEGKLCEKAVFPEGGFVDRMNIDFAKKEADFKTFCEKEDAEIKEKREKVKLREIDLR